MIGDCAQVRDMEQRKEEVALDLQAQRADLEQVQGRMEEALNEQGTVKEQLQTGCVALEQKVGCLTSPLSPPDIHATSTQMLQGRKGP